jgi:DNA polymerase-3 subunit beta
MRVTDEVLELSGYDHRMGIRTMVKCKVEEKGEITCPCDLLVEILNIVEEEEVYFALEDENMIVESGKLQYRMSCITAEDFPAFPHEDTKEKITLKSDILTKGIKRTLIATDENDPRAYMGGVYLEIGKEGISFVATDGRRLSLNQHEEEGVKYPDLKIIVPARTMRELASILPGDDETISISVGEKSISFTFDNVFVVSRLVEADYPNYRRAIPKEYSGSCRLNREKFTKAVRAAAIMARSKETKDILDLELRDELVRLSSSTIDVGAANIEIDAKKKGNDIKFSYNLRFLLDFLNILDDEEVILEYTHETGPGVFHTDSPEFTYVLMPVRV